MNNELRKEYFDKAFSLHSAGKITEAETFYKKILNENPKDAEVLNLLGLSELQQKNYDKAVEFVKQAINIKPVRYFYETLAHIYFQKKEYTEELKTRLEEEKIFGLNFELSFGLGLTYKNLMNFEKSEKYYLKAIDFDNLSRDTYFNLANLYTLFQMPEKAKKYYLKCIEINPNDRESKYFLALNYFRMKDYKNGLKYFETRLCRETAIKTEAVTYPNLIPKTKIWHGEDISDKVLYTYYEAGFGDMIMFSRYIPLLQKKCKKLIVKPQVQLSQLLRDNFRDVEVMDYFYEEKDLKFDVHIPFLSIPYALGLTTENMFISRDKYLSADTKKVEEYKHEFFNNDKFKIGIKWQGNTYYEKGRVINTDAFSELFSINNVQVYSAQTFEGAEEFDKLASQYNIIDLSKSFKDFSYTAAAIANLDLIICNDTSLAHLAGAMGKACIVLLPYNYNWRWHTDLNYCDWYESVKLYRTDKTGNWNTLMKQVIMDLKSTQNL